MCIYCLKTCKACDVSFHPACEKQHDETCSAIGRAQRAVETANRAVKIKEMRIGYREGDNIPKADQEELAALKKAHYEAKKKLDSLY
jgi:hypothetical protein